MFTSRTDEEEGKLIVQVEDTLIGRQRRVPVDMVILSPAMEAQPDSQEISQLLRETGTCAARRTVAKYRESLGIGSSR